ncbi:MAG TPA: hypothetical protein VL359_14400 [bacterium]|nr:hypothetical protein [bacterium]
MRTWRLWLVLGILAGLACLAPARALAADVKVSMDYVQLGSPTYTHDDGTTKLTNSTSMVGTQASLEFLPSQRFGLEVAYALTPLERNYQLGPAGATSNNVTESASYTTFGANLYLFGDDRLGLHPEVGVATGSLAVSQKFSGGTLGTTSTNNTVNVNIVKAGLDYMTQVAGFRLQVQYWQGSTSNSTAITGIRQTVDYSSTAVSLGVFAYF